MSTHNVGFYEELTTIIFQLSSNTHLICFYAPKFEKVGSILVSARPCVCPSVRPSGQKKFKLGF